MLKLDRILTEAGRALALAAALVLAGCSASTIGPQIVHSDGLGLDSPYGSVYASLSGQHLEGEARVSDVQKSGSEAGVGVSGRVLATAGRDKWTFGGGLYATYQSHDAWEKTTAGPVVAARRSWRSGSAEMALYGPDGDKVEWSAGLRLVGSSRLAPLVEYERVEHSLGSGEKVTAGMVWRVNSWQR